MMKNKKIDKLWGTAFKKQPKEEAVLFAAGRDVVSVAPADEVLIPFEIKASIAYAQALYEQKIINKTALNKLLKALKELEALYQQGKFKLDPQKEDVHTNIEAFLIKKLGIDLAGKIHSGRSRSDQAMVDILLYIKSMNDIFKTEIKKLIKVLGQTAKKYQKTLIPGYTHYQPATVTTLANMLDAYKQAFKKDLKKFKAWNQLEEISSLGAGAAYGSIFPINKKKINQHLGLKQVFQNEIQAISSKGEAETLMVFNLCLLMNHLSSLAQTLIVFSTQEFGFITISDEYSTGSSIMPQKKNPDSLEVMKAKASICQGYLMSLLSLTKAGFVGYNRDLQWSKYLVMDAINESLLAPKIMAGVIKTMKVNQKTMAQKCSQGFILAQAVMEGLAMEFNLPMRLAKMIVEETVKQSQGKFELKILNQVIKKYPPAGGLKIKVSAKQWAQWTDPLAVAQAQMKK